MTETAEEAVVDKEARIKEELVSANRTEHTSRYMTLCAQRGGC